MFLATGMSILLLHGRCICLRIERKEEKEEAEKYHSTNSAYYPGFFRTRLITSTRNEKGRYSKITRVRL